MDATQLAGHSDGQWECCNHVHHNNFYSYSLANYCGVTPDTIWQGK